MKGIAVPDALAPDVAEAVARALEELAGPHVSSAYLFGSHAAGRAHRESDVDVGVLVSWKLDRGQRFEERVRLAGALPGKVGGRPVDGVVLNDAPRTLADAPAQAGSPGAKTYLVERAIDALGRLGPLRQFLEIVRPIETA